MTLASTVCDGAMMRSFFIFLSVFLVGQPAIAQEIPTADAIGESLVEAIVSNDVVGYSQCWISSRRMAAVMVEIGVDEIPVKELRKYHSLRNKSIAESFSKIQKLIGDAKIARESIRLKSCKASGVREKKAPGGSITTANQFALLVSVGDDEWRFTIDDGFVDRGMWYFSDSPINLFAGDVILSFRDHRNEQHE